MKAEEREEGGSGEREKWGVGSEVYVAGGSRVARAGEAFVGQLGAYSSLYSPNAEHLRVLHTMCNLRNYPAATTRCCGRC